MSSPYEFAPTEEMTHWDCSVDRFSLRREDVP